MADPEPRHAGRPAVERSCSGRPVPRGEAKLQLALEAFAPQVAGRVALDVGALTGGFTRALLDAGARRVYAVDAGHGQLLGSLRQDIRAWSTWRRPTSARSSDPGARRDRACDHRHLLPVARPRGSAARADQLGAGGGDGCPGQADVQLGLAAPPPEERLDDALRHATDGIAAAAGWVVCASMRSPLPGAGGALELFVHARRE